MGISIYKVERWKTPVSNYPQKQLHNIRIAKKKYKRGLYYMEGVNGYDFFQVVKPITITILQERREKRWHDWMVDDPLHTFGMMGLADNSEGKVLVAGLGLGIIVHYLVQNPKVKQIDVVEINKNVIELIKPLLPKSRKLKIIHDNFYRYLQNTTKEYDTIIVDLWVGKGNRKMLLEMLTCYYRVRIKYPKAKIFIWGIRNSKLNPAVTKENVVYANWR